MKTKFNHWFILLASLLMAGPALALPTNTVTTLEDGPPGSLRYYLPAGGTILFTNGLTGTMSLTNELDITNSVTIVGPGPGILTIIPGFLADCRIFNISAGTTNTISGLTIAHGNPSGPGGGILNAGVLTLMNCSISYNLTSISLGGGIYSSGPLTLLNCTIEDNTAQNGNAYGGGIYSSNTLTLVNCLVTGNYTYTAGPSGGGGIEAQGPLAMTNCTVSFNATEGGTVPNGGGIDIESDSSSLVNCTIASNSVTGGFGGGIGGGIDVGPFSSCMLISCTISGNSAGAGGYGGGIFVDPEAESAIFGNTIVSGNSVDPGGIQPDVFGYVQSLGYNLIGDVAGDTGWIAYGTATNADLTGSSSTGVIDPLLGPLRNNGGPTPTMAPALGSLVIDAGYSFGLTTDQRGSPRPFIYPASQRRLFFLGDGSDIGAVELPVAPTLTNTIKSVNGSTRMVISWAYDEPRMTNAPATNPPAFNLQSTAKLASGTWSVYQKNVVRIGGADHHFLTTDDMMSNGVPIMSEFFQLSSTGPKNPFIGPPITGSASNILTTTATLNGTDPPAGTNTVYWFVYGPDTNYGSFTATNSLAYSTNPVPAPAGISGLSPSTTYHFQLMVTDDEWGDQYGGDQSFATLDPVPLVSTQPASFIASTSAQLNGIINPEGPGSDNAYFEYGLDTNEQHQTQSPLFFPSGNNTLDYSYTPTDLAANTTYYYRFAAYNNTQAGYGAFLSFTTLPIPVQSPPSVTTQGASSVTTISAQLNGYVNPNGGNTTNYFEWGTNTLYGNTTALNVDGTTSQAVSATLPSLASSTTYYYRLDAANSGGLTLGSDTNFTTAWVPVAPTLVSPGTSTDTGYAVNTTQPTCTWVSIPQASSYGIVITAYPGNTVVYQNTGLVGNSFQIPSGYLSTGFGHGIEYSWTMTSFNSLGAQSAASAALIFTDY